MAHGSEQVDTGHSSIAAASAVAGLGEALTLTPHLAGSLCCRLVVLCLIRGLPGAALRLLGVPCSCRLLLHRGSCCVLLGSGLLWLQCVGRRTTGRGIRGAAAVSEGEAGRSQGMRHQRHLASHRLQSPHLAADHG